VRLREVGECPGGFFFVSDFVQGSNLVELLKQGPVSVKRAVRWTNQLLLALEYVGLGAAT
jgi:serine/threonine protein kinase